MSRVYVGIVTYNSLADLPACLDALRAQTQPNVQILVWDNASTDGTPDWLTAHASDVTLHRSGANLGFGAGHNALIRACAPTPDDFYVTVNPDLRMEPAYLAHLRRAVQDSGAGWGTGRLYLPAQADSRRKLYSVGHALRRDGYALNIGWNLPDLPTFDQRGEVFGAPGCGALYSGRLIAALAPEGALFDPDMFMYAEDTDLDWRARRAGWRCVYAPDAVAFHRGSQPGEALRVHALANRYLSVIKNAALPDLILYNVPLMLLHLAARTVISPRFGLALAGRIARLAPRFWRKRTPSAISRAKMGTWFRWARIQPSGQPSTLADRLRAVRRR